MYVTWNIPLHQTLWYNPQAQDTLWIQLCQSFPSSWPPQGNWRSAQVQMNASFYQSKHQAQRGTYQHDEQEHGHCTDSNGSSSRKMIAWMQTNRIFRIVHLKVSQPEECDFKLWCHTNMLHCHFRDECPQGNAIHQHDYTVKLYFFLPWDHGHEQMNLCPHWRVQNQQPEAKQQTKQK